MADLKQRLYTIDDIYNLPDFIRTEMFDGKFTGMSDYTNIIVDEDVFTTKPTRKKPITYRVSMVKDN